MSEIINKNFQIHWEDEDLEQPTNSSNLITKKEQDTNEFTELLKSLDNKTFSSPQSITYKPKQKVKGTIISLGEQSQDVLINLDGKYVGILPKNEILDEHGNLSYKVGDVIDAVVLSVKGSEVYLSKSLALSLKTKEELYMAYKTHTPVKGKVCGINKGGFEISILGYKMFCPVSQIDIKHIDDKEAYLGKEYDFIITHFNPPHEMVVSRSQALKILQKAKIKILYDEYKTHPDRVYEGVVTDIKNAGVLVDIGGVIGFVPNSELGWGRMLQGYQVASVGDIVKVIILKIENQDTDNPKIILSMKQVSQDPWDSVDIDFKVEQTYTGTVVKLERYGAFVELKPGIEGLLHISEIITNKNIKHPSELFKIGDKIEVKILSINPLNKKISLSFKDKKEDETEQVLTEYVDVQSSENKQIGSLGEALIKVLKPKK